jgi:hypothetical protein
MNKLSSQKLEKLATLTTIMTDKGKNLQFNPFIPKKRLYSYFMPEEAGEEEQKAKLTEVLV